MNNSIESVFNAANKLISAGFNVIPVRDKDEVTEKRTYPMKSPFYGWKQFQTERITSGQFYSMLEQSNTTWIALVLGEISQRTVCIDIDNKHWAGVEHKLFSALKDMYPELWKKLRIHQSQSGGYHIIFRMPEGTPIERSKKLAYKEGEKEAGIELKGEGGIIVIPPSAGYKHIQGVGIPLLSEQEIAIMFAIIEDINEKKVIKKERVNKAHKEDNYYSVNPFEDFNNSRAAEEILLKYGWTIESESNHFIHFTRPGKKGGISASFIKDKRCFHIFTTSDDLEGGQNYSPCSLVQAYEKMDGKDLYKWLIAAGFGKADPIKEKQRAQKLASTKSEPLENFSEEAKAIYNEVKQNASERLPYGDFWRFNQQFNVIISRSKIATVANNLGFRLYEGLLYQIQKDKFLHPCTEREFQDALVNYIYSESEDEYTEIHDALESFLQKSTDYTIGRLEILIDEVVLCDTKLQCYKPYKNGVLEITREGGKFLDYTEIDQYILFDNILQRDYNNTRPAGGKYSDFLRLACGLDEYTKKIIGYLSHQWKDETTPYIIVLTEKVADPKNGGGSGKNVFCNLFSNTTSICSTNGDQINYDERFLQSWTIQRIMSISDVPKDFNFSFLKEMASGTIKYRRLFKNAIDIPTEKAPKFIIQTNYSFEVTDGGVRRRLIPLEFTDFFTRCGGVDTHFGAHFPKGWTSEDWADYDNLILDSVQLWMKENYKMASRELSSTGWKKQFEINFGAVISGLIEENITSWISQHLVSSNEFTELCQAYYNDNDINMRYRPGRKRINEALEEYCKHEGINFEKGVNKTVNSITNRYYVFGNGDQRNDASYLIGEAPF